MPKNTEHLDQLKDIRNIMERSSRFLSLSGLSGICAGVFALVGAGMAFNKLALDFSAKDYYVSLYNNNLSYNEGLLRFFMQDVAIVLIASLVTGFFFTWRKAKKQGQPLFNSAGRRLAINLFIPLVVGGFYCLLLMKYSVIALVAPSMLTFYGLALINASKYTLSGVRYLGISQIVLGLIGMYYIGYGLQLWALGFGVLHIIYGTVMYFRYEK